MASLPDDYLPQWKSRSCCPRRPVGTEPTLSVQRQTNQLLLSRISALSLFPFTRPDKFARHSDEPILYMRADPLACGMTSPLTHQVLAVRYSQRTCIRNLRSAERSVKEQPMQRRLEMQVSRQLYVSACVCARNNARPWSPNVCIWLAKIRVVKQVKDIDSCLDTLAFTPPLTREWK